MSELAVESIDEAAGLYFRTVFLPRALTSVPQHVHDYDHALFVAAGAVRVLADGVLLGDFSAGQAIEIKAGKRHLVQALEDGTRLTCVHDVASAESIKRKGV